MKTDTTSSKSHAYEMQGRFLFPPQICTICMKLLSISLVEKT